MKEFFEINIGIDADNGDVIETKKGRITPVERVFEAVTRLNNESDFLNFYIAGKKEAIEKAFNGNIPENVNILETELHYSESKNGKNRPIKGTSLNILVEYLQDKTIDGFLTIGDTARVGVELLNLGRLEGVRKPTLAAILPSKESFYILTDAGATTQRSGIKDYELAMELMAYETFCQAIMSVAYSKACLGVEKPRVGVLSNGVEEHKGSNLVLKLDEMFSRQKSLPEIMQYKGKVEPADAFNGNLDVLVTDGFTGNIYLKDAEACASLIKHVLKETLGEMKLWEKLMFTPSFFQLRKFKREFMHKLNPSRYAGAAVLGYDGIIAKGHGNSDSEAVYYGIKKTAEFVQNHCRDRIVQYLAKYAAEASSVGKIVK